MTFLEKEHILNFCEYRKIMHKCTFILEIFKYNILGEQISFIINKTERPVCTDKIYQKI